MWTPEQINYLFANHGVITSKEIAEHVGKTNNAVRLYARKHGLKTAGNRRKHFFNEQFFNTIDSEAKAYFLGFIAADGTVINNENRREVRLYGHAQDIDIFEKFRSYVELNTPVKTFPGRLGAPHMQMSLYSTTMVNELIDLGVVPNKTFVIEFPNIRSQYYNHYIRGYFDGDGSIFKIACPECKTQRFGFSIVSGSRLLIESIYNILGNETNITAKIRPPIKNDNSYAFLLRSKLNLLDIYNYMYDDATIFGERKKAKFDEFIIENSFEKNVDSFRASGFVNPVLGG